MVTNCRHMNRKTKQIRIGIEAYKELKKKAKDKTMTQVLDELLIKK